MTAKMILLCAGGTGGHMFPADALARELVARGHNVVLATDARGKRFEPFAGGIKLYVLSSGAIIGGLKGKIDSLRALIKGTQEAKVLLSELKPDVVVGFGGYPSFPPVLMAQLQKIPTVIHESNAVLGLANVALAPMARKIATPTENMNRLRASDRAKIVVTGNPVRPDIAAVGAVPYPDWLPGQGISIFVTGGSQGAQVLTEVLPRALAHLPEAERKRVEVVQQCAEADIYRVQSVYDKAKIKAELRPFFRDMADRLRAAHLFIGRSGASTVAEIAAAGRPALFVPYPHHKDQQQLKNARILADVGAAWILEQKVFSPQSVLAQMKVFLQNPDILKEAAEKARAQGQGDAARKLADTVLSVTGE